MKIGIIVYSQTGNTLSVAEKVKAKLEARGHAVVIEKVELAAAPTMKDPHVNITVAPDASKYDAVIFGAPVQAFRLCAAMQAYMDQLGTLDGKKVACFITKGLKGAWTGGNGALKALKTFCESRGGQAVASGMVIWPVKDREQSIETLAEDLAKAF